LIGLGEREQKPDGLLIFRQLIQNDHSLAQEPKLGHHPKGNSHCASNDVRSNVFFLCQPNRSVIKPNQI
jgi:hypothetical protein